MIELVVAFMLDLFIFLIECVKYRLGIRLILGEEANSQSNVKRNILVLGLGAAINIFVFVLLQGMGVDASFQDRYLLIYVIVIGCYLFLVQGTFIKRVGRVLVLFVFIASADEIFEIPLETLMAPLRNTSVAYMAKNLLSSLCGLVIISGLFYVSQRGWIKRFEVKQRILFGLLFFCALDMETLVASVNLLKNYVTDSYASVVIQTIVSLSYISLFFLFWSLVFLWRQGQERKKQLSMERELKNSQKIYYELLLKKEEQTRCFRHDIDNHVFYMMRMAEQKRWEDLSQYLVNLRGDLNRIQELSYCTGNELVDILLTSKLAALDSTVLVQIKGKFVCELDMEDYKLCIIFSNLIQNAVEALQSCPFKKKQFTMRIIPKDTCTTVIMENSAVMKEELHNNRLPQTTKADKEQHGIGLRNVEQILKQNQSHLQISYSNQTFCVQFSLAHLPFTKL